jgi:hypothetical protein
MIVTQKSNGDNDRTGSEKRLSSDACTVFQKYDDDFSYGTLLLGKDKAQKMGHPSLPQSNTLQNCAVR